VGDVTMVMNGRDVFAKVDCGIRAPAPQARRARGPDAASKMAENRRQGGSDEAEGGTTQQHGLGYYRPLSGTPSFATTTRVCARASWGLIPAKLPAIASR
jgi:hypothetical protein